MTKYIVLALGVLVLIGGIVLTYKRPAQQVAQTSMTPEMSASVSPMPEESGSMEPQASQSASPSPTAAGSSKPVKKESGKVTGTVIPASQGRVLITLSHTSSLSPAVSGFFLHVADVKAYSQATGWVTLAKTPRVYDLMKLKQTTGSEMLADLGLDVGTYTQLQVTLDKVIVLKDDVIREAFLPSNVLRVPVNLIVMKGETSGVLLNMHTERALFKTSKGTYVYFPIIAEEARSLLDTIQIFAYKVEMIGGKTDFVATFGTDENGSIKTNFMFDPVTSFELIGNTVRVITKEEKDTSVPISAESAVTIALGTGRVQNALSVKTTVRNGKLSWRVYGMKNTATVILYIDAVSGEIVGVE